MKRKAKFQTIVVDIHEDEILTVDVENIETNLSEEVVVSYIKQDSVFYLFFVLYM